MELKPAATPEKKKSEAELKLEQNLQGLLEPGETLLGATAASQQKGMFSGGVVQLAVTDRRLIVQPLDRRGRDVKGNAISITQSEIAKAKISRAGGAWDDPSAVLMSQVAIQVKIKATGGEKYRFSMMDGQGNGLLGGLSGGPSQQTAVQALRAFLGDSDSASEI